MSNHLTLFTISGPDHPGITAELMGTISKLGAKLVDIGQSITHGLLSLSFIIESDTERDILAKEIMFIAKKHNMEVEYKEVKDEIHELRSGEKYILSCVALNGITPNFLSEIASVLAQNNINIQRIDNIADDKLRSLDISAWAKTDDVDWDKIKSELITISNSHQTDLALLKDNVWRRNKRLIVFDMDSTLIQSEVIVEIARAHGVYDEVHRITEEAMNGEHDFDESLRKRVALLKGFDTKQLDDILKNIKLTEGVEEFTQIVKKLGYKVAIISGGFTYFANHFKEKLGLDYAFANELEISQGILTGKVKGSIVNADKKAMLVELITQQENINLEQVVAIGDGANDLPMLAKAGLGIAFHAKEIVKKNAKQHMSHGPMTSILYFLGIPGSKDI